MKLKFPIIIFILFQYSLLLIGSETGVQKYVWALHGLNLRSSPNIQSSIVKTLIFGDSVIVLETTNVPYSKKVIDTLYFYNEPLYLKSKWVKIKAGNNEGYVVNAYLLDIPCPLPKESINNYARRMAERFTYSDLSYSLPIEGGTVTSTCSKCEFPSGKKLGFYTEEDEKKIMELHRGNFKEEGNAVSVYFKYFTSQEILIFLNRFNEILENRSTYMDLPYKVYKNELNRISLTDNSTQEIDIYIYESGEIIYYYFNAGC